MSRRPFRRTSRALFLLPLFLFGLVLLFAASGAVLAADYDHEIADVMGGKVSGVSATVNGSGGLWYGQSLRVSFVNNTSKTLRVKVPIGTRFVPADASVQTMYTAGDEVIDVPPQTSARNIQAFCGEMHDHAPSVSDSFTPDGRADGALLETLRAIHDRGIYDESAQNAVWHVTDNRNISGDPVAQDLVRTAEEDVSPAEVAAGGMAAAAAVGAAAAASSLGGGGAEGSGHSESKDEGGDG